MGTAKPAACGLADRPACVLPPIPDIWRSCLQNEVSQAYYCALDGFLDAEQAAGHTILPARNDIFNALRLTAPAEVKVVLLGQDPYPTPGHACGLCFAVRHDVRPLPGSLRNLYKELAVDVGVDTPVHGSLEAWACRGVLLLNTVLTVRAGEANSHRNRGWERFTDCILQHLSARSTPVVFMLLGRQAQARRHLVSAPQHRIVEAAHPSPLSARRFLGCRCFSAANKALVALGQTEIDWRLPLGKPA